MPLSFDYGPEFDRYHLSIDLTREKKLKMPKTKLSTNKEIIHVRQIFSSTTYSLVTDFEGIR